MSGVGGKGGRETERARVRLTMMEISKRCVRACVCMLLGSFYIYLLFYPVGERGRRGLFRSM